MTFYVVVAFLKVTGEPHPWVRLRSTSLIGEADFLTSSAGHVLWLVKFAYVTGSTVFFFFTYRLLTKNELVAQTGFHETRKQS